MGFEREISAPNTKKTDSGVCMSAPEKETQATMRKPEAKALVLEFMAEYDVPMPPTVLYRSLRLKKNFTYSDETLLNYLGELVDSDAVLRVDPAALENREIVPVSDADTRCYYVITDTGRERVV